MNTLRLILSEIRKQLMNIPSFVHSFTPSKADYNQLSQISDQILKAIQESPKRIIFLLAPFGAGKTTQIKHFCNKYSYFKYKYRSFIKINTIDFAFLHMTNYWSRLFFLFLNIGLALILMHYFPALGPLPFLLVIGVLFTKNFANLIYILHESIASLFMKYKIVIIEDLERSSLSFFDQWGLLANLWQAKRSYIVTLGYAPDEREEALKLMEFSIKLGGVLIELPPNELAIFEMIKDLDPDFPFEFNKDQLLDHRGWLSLFTFREMLSIHEQVLLATSQLDLAVDLQNTSKTHKKQIKYLSLCFKYLMDKLGLKGREITFVEKTLQIKEVAQEVLEADQRYYLISFKDSIIKNLNVGLTQDNPKK